MFRVISRKNNYIGDTLGELGSKVSRCSFVAPPIKRLYKKTPKCQQQMPLIRPVCEHCELQQKLVTLDLDSTSAKISDYSRLPYPIIN